jgi:hypothetical protein
MCVPVPGLERGRVRVLTAPVTSRRLCYRTFTVDTLKRMGSHTLPVTLVDAAFRGKELAMHKSIAGCAHRLTVRMS